MGGKLRKNIVKKYGRKIKKNYCKKDMEGKLRKIIAKKRVRIRKRKLIKK